MTILSIENLSELNERLPESVAREINVLIVAIVNNELTIAHPKTGFGDEDRERVEFIMNCPLIWVAHELDEIRVAVNVAYGTIRDVDGCTWKFANECPQR